MLATKPYGHLASVGTMNNSLAYIELLDGPAFEDRLNDPQFELSDLECNAPSIFQNESAIRKRLTHLLYTAIDDNKSVSITGDVFRNKTLEVWLARHAVTERIVKQLMEFLQMLSPDHRLVISVCDNIFDGKTYCGSLIIYPASVSIERRLWNGVRHSFVAK